MFVSARSYAHYQTNARYLITFTACPVSFVLPGVVLCCHTKKFYYNSLCTSSGGVEERMIPVAHSLEPFFHHRLLPPTQAL